MERNRDLRRASVAAANGLPRRRHEITTRRDSPEDDLQMELQESVRFRDRERAQKKNKSRDFSKRRRVERHRVQHNSGGGSNREVETEGGYADCTDDSYEGDHEEEEHGRIHQVNRMNRPGPPSSSLSNNQSHRRSLRTLRSAPVIRVAFDEIIGVPIPRRPRSAKLAHENSGSGGFGEDPSHRRLSPMSASPNCADVVAPTASSDICLTEKMKLSDRETGVLYCSSNSKHSSADQEDIEIEVAEALFDLMKQSQSQSSRKQEKVDSDRKNTDGDRSSGSPIEQKAFQTPELPQDSSLSFTTLLHDGLKGQKVKDGTFLVQNEQLKKVDIQTITVEPVELNKEKFPSQPVQESIGDGVFVNKDEMVDGKESELTPCAKVNFDEPVDSTGTKANTSAMNVETNRKPTFGIDLTASPPLPSLERDGSTYMVFDPKCTTQNVQMDVSEAVAMQSQGEKMGWIGVKESQNLDFEQPYHDDTSSSSCSKPQPQGWNKQKNQSQSSSLPFQIATSGWPGVLPHPGFMPSMKIVIPIDGNARSSTAVQLPLFKLQQPRPKRCLTHLYIARNIHYQQQLTKKALWSGAAGPATLLGDKSLNQPSLPPMQKLILGNSLRGDLSGGQNLATVLGSNRKDKSAQPAPTLDTRESKMAVLQQSLQQVPAGMLHGPAFIFPLGHHQAAVAAGATANQSGGAVATSFNQSNFPSNEAPPYSSTTIEMPPLKGGTQVPIVPFFNCSIYSSPAFSVSQSQPQLSHTRTSVQSAPQNTSTSNETSFLKAPHSNQQTGMKISGSSFLMENVHSQQPNKQQLQPSHSSSKADADISRKSSAVFSDSLVSHSLKTNNGQKFSVPVRPMNFSLIPPGKMSGGAVGNKHGDPQKQGSNGRVEVIPQTFSLSFGSNASTTPAINLSSMAQNSAIFQMLPDMARYGYQMAPAAQMAQHKNLQVPEGKTASGSASTGDQQKVLGKSLAGFVQSLTYSKLGSIDPSASSIMGTSIFGGSARTINVIPVPVAGNRLTPPPSSAASATTSVVSVTENSQQQQQLIQLQKQHMQLTGTAQFKESPYKGFPGSFVASSFPSNNPASSKSKQWQNLPRTAGPGASSASATSGLLSIPLQQIINSQSPTQISFGSGPASAGAFQGQHITNSSYPPASVGSPSHSSISKNTGGSITALASSKTGSTTVAASPSRQTESSPNGPSQKSSPACGRNVPPILSTCPSQVSEIKY